VQHGKFIKIPALKFVLFVSVEKTKRCGKIDIIFTRISNIGIISFQKPCLRTERIQGYKFEALFGFS